MFGNRPGLRSGYTERNHTLMNVVCVDGYCMECLKYIALVWFQIWSFRKLLDCGNVYV